MQGMELFLQGNEQIFYANTCFDASVFKNLMKVDLYDKVKNA